MKRIMHNGVEYPSLKSLCKSTGVSYNTVWLRMSKGESLDEALETKSRFHGRPRCAQRARKGREITVRGVTYRSISEAARANGINPSTINQRISYGYTLEEAFDFEKNRRGTRKARDNKNRQFSINGRQYRSIKDFCTRNGYEAYYSQIIKRTGRGEKLIDIISNLEKKPPSPDFVEIKGEKYRNYSEFCKTKGIFAQYGSFIEKIRKGMAPDEAYEYVKEIVNLRNQSEEQKEIK